MTATWLSRLARVIGIRRSALARHPAWFDAAYLSSPEDKEERQAPPMRTYSERERAAVWHKGWPMPGWDPEDWRTDHRGSVMFRHHYGDTGSAYRWQVGRIAADGGDDLANLRPELCRRYAPATARSERAFDLDRFAQ